MFAVLAAAALSATSASQPKTELVYEAPAQSAYAQIVPGGTTILPNGRFLTPAGKRLYTGDDLWQVVVRPDGQAALGMHDGGLSLYTSLEAAKPERKAVQRRRSSFAGVFLKSKPEFVMSTGDDGGIEILDAATLESKAIISANAGRFKDTYINDLVVSRDEKLAYGVDVAHQRVVVFDLEARRLVESTPAGRQPYALALSADGSRLFVANIGIFNYSLVPKGPGGETTITRPPFAFPSPESEKGVQMEGRFIPGIGSPYVADAQSIYAYDLKNPQEPKLAKTGKAGILIHAPADSGKAVGGSAPNKIIVHGKVLYVSCANNDIVQKLDAATLKPLGQIKLAPSASHRRLRGVIPSGMAIDPAAGRLYVCESGLNSVAVVSLKTDKVIGRFASGWFPTDIKLSPDRKRLFVATQKGLGRGPQGPHHQRPATDERFGFPAMPGMIQMRPVPSDKELAGGTAEVLRNNGLVPVRRPLRSASHPRVPGRPSPVIKHVVFITKENHTFDGIMGELVERGAKGDARYAEWGRKGWIREKNREAAPVMTNHMALADRWAVSDNFYMEPQASGDGHRWLVGVYPSLWTTRVFYSGWEYRPVVNAQGRFVSFGSYGTQFPEDYLENGSIWEHLARHKLSFRNYGEGYEMPRGYQDKTNNRTGVSPVMNHPMPKVLFDNTDFDFPAYNTWIPDVFRADWFKEDMEEYKAKNGGLPRFINIAICNDHGDSARPGQGYPYLSSYMADNDLALGRIVEYLSRQKEWKNMAIFVTQDDPGGDNDSVDRHRSIVMAIGPYCKKGYISKEHTSIMSIIKSIYLLFGLGANNMFDAVATDLSDMFTDTPDFAPYTAVPVDPRVFVEVNTIDPTDPKFERRRRESRPTKMDDPAFMEWLRKGGTGTFKKEKDKDD